MFIDLATILKIVGLICTFISGLAALNLRIRGANKKLNFIGYSILSALIFGVLVSILASIKEYYDKETDKVRVEQEIRRAQNYAATSVFNLKGAKFFASLSVDKNNKFLSELVSSLDNEINYALSNCKEEFSRTKCKDYIFDDFDGPKISFTNNSEIYKNASEDTRRMLNYSGLMVEFYKRRLNHLTEDLTNLPLRDRTVNGAMSFAPWYPNVNATFEYNGSRLTWEMRGDIPEKRFDEARILSVVELSDRAVVVSPIFNDEDYAVDVRREGNSDKIRTIRAYRQEIEVGPVSITFPHRRNINLYDGMIEATSKYKYKYKYKNMPINIEDFYQGSD